MAEQRAVTRCCRCASTGSCLRCSCVASGKSCDACYPSKKGRCRNLNPVIPSSHSVDQEQDSLSSALEPLVDEIDRMEPRTDHSPDLELPAFKPAMSTNFTWGSLDSSETIGTLGKIYIRVVGWKPNLFRIPNGRNGKAFTEELSRLYWAFAEGSALESIALQAAIVFPLLMLQKPHRRSKDSEHKNALESRLNRWSKGEFMGLLEEGNAIQVNLGKYHIKKSREAPPRLPREFAGQMSQGKTKAALNLISGGGRSGILKLDEQIIGGDETTSVRQILKDKHPPAQGLNLDSTNLDSTNFDQKTYPPPTVHPVTFERIDSVLIRRFTLNCRGAAGPSGLDAYDWRRLCTGFGKTSDDLCNSVASMAKRLCVELVDPKILSPFLACRLIALNKNPGVRPIGIGDTLRRIIAKAILSGVRPNIQEVAGLYQLCAGQSAGVESAAHAAREMFMSEDNGSHSAG